MRIGILGGTFDPPHLAHLHTGEVAYHQLGLDMVVFMPAGAPWQKAARHVSAPEHRWAMTRLAVAGVDYFVADDREVHRDGWTYTADTLADFDDELELVLILGADSARNLPTWHRATEVLERVVLAVAPRPSTAAADVETSLQGKVEMHWLDMVPLDVSGTQIRRRVSRGLSTRFLVRDAVWRYFIEEDLYADEIEASVG
ncbi:MAG TPA: nicotinate-nucleotide adenylyltransferase [Acidimicrobiia bacterium]|nr:nicotinate-nucleotide adenylyltransferase [Acidimicrobiia bacterium]